MPPVTFILLAGLCIGAFVCLALLYLTLPYPSPSDIDARQAPNFWGSGTFNPEGRHAEEQRAARRQHLGTQIRQHARLPPPTNSVMHAGMADRQNRRHTRGSVGSLSSGLRR